MIAEAGSHHHSTQNQRKQEHDVSGQEGNLQKSSAPDENSHETATADKTLLTAAQSSTVPVSQTRGKPDEDSRLSLRSSRSLADNIRFNPNTKVYVKVAKKDEHDAHEDGVTDQGESVNECSTKDAFVRSKGQESPSSAMSKYEKTEDTLIKNEDSGQPYESARDSRKQPTDSRRKNLRDPQESRLPNDPSHKQAKESGPKNFRDPQESRWPNDPSHKQATDSGRKNARDPHESRSTNPCSAGGTETRNPSDQQAAFSDMIRKTLQRNRSSLLPQAGTNDSRRQPTTASRPLISLLGTSSDFPAQHSACSPSALSTSQTSLASSQLQESSDIYDVPKHSRDWQRAMSLLSLSAVGSGVFRDPRAPDAEREDDGYIDMTQGLRGGSVPDLNKVGKGGEDGAGEESPYYLVPSNKHAYINLTFDPLDGRQASTAGSRSDLSLSGRETPPESAPAKKHVEAQLRGPGRLTTSERGEGSTRRWSSSERKTLELTSYPPSTATLLHSRGGPRASGPGSEPGTQRQLSAKLSPAPQLKLYPGKQTASDPRGNRVEFDRTGDLRHAPGDTNTPTKAKQASWSKDDSPNSYARADRNPQMPRSRFQYDSHGGESAPDDNSSAGRTRVGAEDSQSPGDRRPRLSSVQRSPSYSRAVGTRETTEDEGEKKGEQSKRFPFCIEDYVIIPTPRQSRSSSECSRVESKESYC